MNSIDNQSSRPVYRLVRFALFGASVAVCYLALAPADLGGRGGNIDHAYAFLTLGLLSRLAFPRANFLLVLLVLAGLGGAIEILQGTMHEGRDMQMIDFKIDIVAAIAGLAVGMVVNRVLRGWRARD